MEAYRYSTSWKLYRKLQRKGWFKCSSIRRSRIMFRTLSERTTGRQYSISAGTFAIELIADMFRRTFIFPNVF